MRDGEFVLLFRRMIAEEWGKKCELSRLPVGRRSRIGNKTASLSPLPVVQRSKGWTHDGEFVSLASGTTVYGWDARWRVCLPCQWYNGLRVGRKMASLSPLPVGGWSKSLAQDREFVSLASGTVV